MNQQPHNDESASALIAYFAERLNRVFAYPFCIAAFRDDDDFRGDPSKNARTWALQTIHNACLHTSLMAIRDLNDVLSPRAHGHADDFKVSDLGFPTSLSFLSASEREQINKHIAHSTLPGAAARISIRWDIFELTTKTVRQALTFLDWAQNHFGQHFLSRTAAMACRRQTQGIYDEIAKMVEAHRATGG